jgi:hypothetical protein
MELPLTKKTRELKRKPISALCHCSVTEQMFWANNKLNILYVYVQKPVISQPLRNRTTKVALQLAWHIDR